MKGQTLEMIGFLLLSVAIIVVILFMRVYLTSSYGKSFLTLSERQEIEGSRAGANTILQTTEIKTRRTLLDLLGIAAYQTDPELDFGPVIGKVNPLQELEWRMDSIYGEEHWYVQIPYPDVIPRYQIIVVVDSSGSLCDDFSDIANDLPKIIEDLREQGYNVAATIFMLPGGAKCCRLPGGISSLNCQGLFETTKNIHCINLDRNAMEDLDRQMCNSQVNPRNSEDWGRGLACSIDVGPYEGWYDFTAKIGIILSDELTTGSENAGTNWVTESMEIAIRSAQGNNLHEIIMPVFPFKANTGKECCPSCSNCPSECEICIFKDGIEWDMFPELCCIHDGELTSEMQNLATETEGTYYELSGSEQAAETIKMLLEEHEFEIKPYLELGTNPPGNKNLNSVIIPVTTPYLGGYTNIYITTWV
jgi:hypothetical protein